MNPHILVVEDDYKTRITLAYEIQYAGYRVTQAPDGETALDLLEQETFQVVLTDIIMGRVDGIEVLHTAKTQPYRPAVILLTGHGALETAIEALNYGAHAYLIKPCPPDKLLSAIASAVQRHTAERQLLQAANALYGAAMGQSPGEVSEPGTSDGVAKRHPSPQVMRVGSLIVGNSRRDVLFQEQRVQLTPIEYALLRCLAEVAGQTRRYSDIVRQTHHCEVNDTDAQTLISSHIHNLRKKIDPSMLINDRGVGYLLVNPDEPVEQEDSDE